MAGVTANRRTLGEILLPEFCVETAIGKDSREHSSMSVCAMACNARGRAILIDLQSMRPNPVVPSQVHPVRTFWFWHLYLVALIAIPRDSSVLRVRIAMARRTLQAAMSPGCLVCLALVDSESIVSRLARIAAFIQYVRVPNPTLRMQSCADVAAPAIGHRDSFRVGTVAVCAGKILGSSCGRQR